MPLPSDEKLIALANDVLKQFDTMFGLHPGFRPAHAKGLLLSGRFTPSPEASSLTRAPHVTRPETPVLARFSNSTGLPAISDTDANANPRGLALRFQLAEHVHTDIISHAADGFPTRTASEFLELLKATAAGKPETFLANHPETLRFVQMPKPHPASFGTEKYFGVTAMRFLNQAGDNSFGRYRITPEAGTTYLSDEDAKTHDSEYLFEELRTRVTREPIRFKIAVQVAGPTDIVDNATVHWPEDRRIVEFGRVELTSVVVDSDHEQKRIIFDPIPRVDGIEPSDDPLLELRAAIYLMSGRRRRQAPEALAASEG